MNAAFLAALLAAPALAGVAEPAAVAEDLALVLRAAGLPPDAVAFARAATAPAAPPRSRSLRRRPDRALLVQPRPARCGRPFYHGLKGR